jgi:hypothetical protein
MHQRRDIQRPLPFFLPLFDEPNGNTRVRQGHPADDGQRQCSDDGQRQFSDDEYARDTLAKNCQIFRGLANPLQVSE